MPWLYKENPQHWHEYMSRALVDLVALSAICMIAVETYAKTGSKQSSFIHAVVALTCAYILPVLFLRQIVEYYGRGGRSKLGIGVLVIVFLFALELLLVHAIESTLPQPDEL